MARRVVGSNAYQSLGNFFKAIEYHTQHLVIAKDRSSFYCSYRNKI